MIDLLSLLNQNNISYVNTSSGYKINCINPYHVDKNPSMYINPNFPHLYNCFSCGCKGNIFTLIKTLTGEIAKDYLKENSIYQKFEYRKIAKRFRQMNIKGNMYDFYSNKDSKLTKDFLKERNISKEFVNYYKLQYSRYITINNTIFSDRVLIPIYEDNILVSIEGRTLVNNKVKVLYPRGSKTDLLFDIDRLDIDKPLYLVEGIMDVMPLFNLGFRNITCTFGSNVSDNQIISLNKFKEIIFIPDNDEAGEIMFSKLDSELDKEFYFVKLPMKYKDLGEIKKSSEVKKILTDKILSIRYIIDKSKLIEKEEVCW